jgi:MinD-like ATPase involved in chromosome partitioning or flagellar assembly
MRLRLATAGLGAAWEAALVGECRRPDARAEVVQRCYDLAELLALAEAGLAHVAVVADAPRWLDRNAVAALARAGIGILAVTTPGDRQADRRLLQLGVAHIAVASETPNRLLQLAKAAAQPLPGIPAPHPPRTLPPGPNAPNAAHSTGASGVGAAARSAPAPGDPQLPHTTPGQEVAPVLHGMARGLPHDVRPAKGAQIPLGMRNQYDPPERQAAADLSIEPGKGGQLLAVWGPKGAPGRTTVAVNLAVEASRLGVETLLVDADTYGGSVAPLLGLLDECPGLAWAARLASRGDLDAALLRREISKTAPAGPHVLVGLPRPDLWTEVRAAVWEHLLATFRAAFPLTVLDLGFCLEEDEELVYDQVRYRRNGVACDTVRQADAILAVTRADPLGLHDFIRGFRALTELGVDPGRVRVVVNQLRGGLFGGDATTQIQAALDRYLGVEPDAFVPYDRAGVDAASLVAKALAEARPASPARQALADLTRSILGLPRAPARRWARRRARPATVPRPSATGAGPATAPTAVVDG